MELRTIESLLEDQLKDLYSAEAQLLKALGKMAERSRSRSLRDAFEMHMEETREHIERLRRIGEELGMRLGGKKCAAMEGIVEEGEEVLEADGEGAVVDAALIAAAQRAEHYEITAYGTARTLAKHLGLQHAAEELQRTLEEESATDEKLTRISVDELLPVAGQGGMGGADMDEGGEGEEAEAGTPRRRGGTRRRTAGRAASSGAKGGASTRSKKGKSATSRSQSRSKGRSGGSRSRSGASSRRR